MAYRRKVLVVPYTSSGKVLMVQDRRTKEYGFVSGGVKNHETYLQSAIRELKEETFINNKHLHFVRTFKTSYRPPELLAIDKKRKERVTSTYYIYSCKINEKTDLISFKENDEIIDVKCDYFNNFENLWDFCYIALPYISFIQLQI